MTNQSELEANTCNRRQARESACRQDRIGFGFTSDWLRKWREFLNQSESEVKLDQSKHEFTFDIPLKNRSMSSSNAFPFDYITRGHQR